jgi:hypothetical protein
MHLTKKDIVPCLVSGIGWSVSFLLVLEIVHGMTDANTALILAWPIKIAWSTIHTAISRWRGARAVTIRISKEPV